jgi:hypothetical protein
MPHPTLRSAALPADQFHRRRFQTKTNLFAAKYLPQIKGQMLDDEQD